MFFVWHINKKMQDKIISYLAAVVTESFDRNIHVEIEYDLEISVDGWTYFDGDTIFVSYKNKIGLAHELVHVAQILNKRFNPDTQEWEEKLYKAEQPWEDEAYKLELEVQNKWLM
jgi:hypothetical protein